MRRRRDRQMPLATEHSRGRIHPDPAGAGQINLGPGVQIGKILVRALWPVDRLDVGAQLNEIARDEARGEAEITQDLNERPGRIAAGAGSKFQGFLRRLDAGLHPDQIADRLLQRSIEIDEEIDNADRALGQSRDIGCQARAKGFGVKVGRELRLQLGIVSERKLLGIGLDEKIEWIDDRKFGGQIDLDLELRYAFRKHEPRLPIAMRILLPVHEMIRRRHLERIGGDLCPAVRGRAQPDGLRLQHDRPVVFVVGNMMDGGGNGH